MTLPDLITSLQAGNGHIIEVTESHTSPVSPPPFMAGAAEIEVDLETGKITPITLCCCGRLWNRYKYEILPAYRQKVVLYRDLE